MAVAWCINAYDCSWNLIRTLEQLQSSNIGVWVQYTAPNPLDDKKIDYIKYTDKCGYTCTLSWENEILIYSTNWVIKNLSLTNDDTNEKVIVKWTDLFGSNRAKTVVRYKTWSYPSSPTDWTLAVEETTQNQYQTNWYWVSWLTDWTTYYFSVFALDWDGKTINVQSMSITVEFWRVPNSDTILFIKWNWDITDYSQNHLSTYWSWTASYSTLSNWRKVLNFDWNNIVYSEKLNWTILSTSMVNFTVHIWVKSKNWYNTWDASFWGWMWRSQSSSSTTDRRWAKWQRDSWASTFYIIYWPSSSSRESNTSYYISYSNTDFWLYSFTINWRTVKLYKNWSLVSTWTWSYNIRWCNSWSDTSTHFSLWGITSSSSWTVAPWQQVPCYIWESAFLKKTETDAEVLNFYNKTKKHYWY